MTQPRTKRVLVTGSAGRVGRATVSALTQDHWDVRGFDRAPTPGLAHSVIGNLTDQKALRAAAEGAEALIHLGATPDDDDFLGQLLPNNLVGLHHTLEAARDAGIRRLLIASTGQVNWWQQIKVMAGASEGSPTPRHWYAVTKVAAEAAGKAFAKSYGMTVLALRLGWCPRTRAQVEEIALSERGQDTYLSPGDAGRFFVRALEADLPPGFHTLFVASRPLRKVILELSPTESLLNWKPQDQWPTGADEDLR